MTSHDHVFNGDGSANKAIDVNAVACGLNKFVLSVKGIMLKKCITTRFRA